MKKIATLALFLAACVMQSTATSTAKRYAAHVPGATGAVECTSSWENYQYCSIFMQEAAPLSVRCDEDTCTTIGAPAQNHTTVMPVVVHH